MGSIPVAVTQTSDFTPASSKEFLDIQETIECGFTLKRICDMIRTYSQMHCTDKCSQHSSIIWPVWLRVARKKDTKNIDPKVVKIKNNRKMMLSRCSICNNKKSTW